MASPGNQHCANCIGTLSFPTSVANMLKPLKPAYWLHIVTARNCNLQLRQDSFEPTRVCSSNGILIGSAGLAQLIRTTEGRGTFRGRQLPANCK